jgi:hypothetical protein
MKKVQLYKVLTRLKLFHKAMKILFGRYFPGTYPEFVFKRSAKVGKVFIPKILVDFGGFLFAHL